LFYAYVDVIANLAKAMSDYQEMTDKITAEMPNHSSLMTLVEKSRTAFDLKPVTTTQEQRNKEDDVYRLSQDPFWEQPEIYKIIDDIIEKCRLANEALKAGEDLEPPNFSTGLTQEFGNNRADRNAVVEDGNVVVEAEQNVTVNDGDVVIPRGVVPESQEVLIEKEQERTVVLEKEREKVGMVVEERNMMLENEDVLVQRGGKEKMQEEQHTDDKEDDSKTPKRTFKIKLGKYEKSPYVYRVVDSKRPPAAKETLFARYLLSFDLQEEQKKLYAVDEEAISEAER